jgi:hypothetical protein
LFNEYALVFAKISATACLAGKRLGRIIDAETNQAAEIATFAHYDFHGPACEVARRTE